MAKNEAKIKFTAETGDFNKAIKQSNDEMSSLRAELRLNDEQMKTTGKSAEGLKRKQELLESQLKASEDKTEALNKKLNKAVEIYGENSSEVLKLKTQVANAQTQEEKLKQAINNCNSELKEQKGASSDAGEGFTVMKGVVADLASNAIQSAIGKISEFCGWLSELPEATRELRQDLSTLNTSFDDVGHSTETATDTWKELYSVFGEDDRAVETANNIAKIAKNEKDLKTWVDITTGAWGKHQDSLPVEGLAEAAMETAKTGSVTGVLADALNWCTKECETYGVKLKKNIEFTKLSSKELNKMTDKQRAEYEAKKKQYDETEKYNQSLKEAKSAEEKFQFALDKCTTEQERSELITNTLNGLYSESADTYRETQGAQMEAKEATADNMLAQADLATSIEPVTTAFSELKTELMKGIQPAVEKVSEAIAAAANPKPHSTRTRKFLSIHTLYHQSSQKMVK
jgi:chromosome segregation ATPase